MLRAPPGSLPRRMAEAAQHAETKLGLFRLVAEILEEQKKDRGISSFSSRGSIKAWIRMQATKDGYEGPRQLQAGKHVRGCWNARDSRLPEGKFEA